MSLGSPSVPTPPGTTGIQNTIDPISLAGLQQSFNVGSGIENQLGSQQNMTTPGWSQNWTQTGTGPGGVPLYGINQSFTDPQAQANYTQYLQNQSMAGSQQVPNLTSQGQAFLTQGATPLYQGQALGPLASQYIGQGNQQLDDASSIIWRGTLPGLATAGNTVAGAANTIGDAAGTMNYAKQVASNVSPWLQQVGGYTAAYNAQNPNSIGDMTSGLAGQRMSAYMSGVQPEQTFQRNSLDTQLRNQGLHPGLPGYDNAMRELDTSTNLANNQSMASYQPQAWQQATQLYQDPLTKAQASRGVAGDITNLSQLFSGVAQGQLGVGQGQLGVGQAQQGLAQSDIAAAQNMINNAQARGTLGAQTGALMGQYGNLGQIYANTGLSEMSQALPWLAASAPTMPPQPSAVPLGIQPVNIGGLGTAYNQQLGANYQNQLAAYNAQLSQNNNMLSGLFGVGSGVLGGLAAGGLFGSDRRLKDNIEPLTVLSNGIPIYTFTYKANGLAMIGPMADEVEKVMPAAVYVANGYKMVDYGKVYGLA